MRRIALLIGLSFSITCLSACVGTLPPQGVKQLKDMDETYRAGDYREVVAQGTRFLGEFGATEPAGEAYYLRGLSYARLNDRARALADFEQTIKSARRSDLEPLARVMLGNIAFEQGMFPTAAQHYQEAVEKLPNETPKDEVLYRLGLCYARRGDWRTAQNWFSQLMHLFPDSAKEPLARRYFGAGCFTIQCGAYLNYENAQRQVDLLRGRGLQAKQVMDAHMKFHLVQVGQYLSYQDARVALRQVIGFVPDAIIVP